MNPDLSICIVSHNTRQLLQQCLESLLATLPAASPSWDIWLVDNASGDGSAAMVSERFSAVGLIENGANLGFARANNQAIEASQGRYILLLNSDTIVQPGAIVQLFEFLEAHPLAGVAGPRLLNCDGSLQASWSSFPSLLDELLGNQSRPGRSMRAVDGSIVYQVDWVGGACLMARREAVDQAGLLDPRFFMYSEEIDWCRRMQAGGWRCFYLPQATVIHLGGGSSEAGSSAVLRQLYRSKLYYFHKHHGRRQAGCLRAGLATRLLARGTYEGLRYFLSLGHYRQGKELLRQRLALAREMIRIDSAGILP